MSRDDRPRPSKPKKPATADEKYCAECGLLFPYNKDPEHPRQVGYRKRGDSDLTQAGLPSRSRMASTVARTTGAAGRGRSRSMRAGNSVGQREKRPTGYGSRFRARTFIPVSISARASRNSWWMARGVSG